MDRERVSPDMYVGYYIKHRGISVQDVGVAPVVVLSWGAKVVESLARDLQAWRCPHWFYDEDHIVYPLFTAGVGDRRVSVAQVPEGAPATVVMMEEMIACGAQTFLGLGWAGSLQPTAPIGTLLVPTGCVRDEGTSLHYLTAGTTLAPDGNLVQLLQDAADVEGADLRYGVQWTTDAPYRELIDKMECLAGRGVLGVDMETSAMYALGSFRRTAVCNLLVVSDELWAEWRPAFRSVEVEAATTLAQRIILRAVRRYLDGESRKSESAQR